MHQQEFDDMKIFRSDQIREIDEFTVKNEPVSSAELMERAASTLHNWYINRFETTRPILVFVGPGNNGGDGLALSRMLSGKGYKPEVFFIKISGNISADWKINSKRLENETKVPLYSIGNIAQFPVIRPGSIIIDAIFGSGLSRPPEGLAAEIITHINNSGATVISIDTPSGLFCEDNSNNNPDSIIQADITLSFEFPKLSFMFPENGVFTGEWYTLPIGLHPEAVKNTITPFNLLEKSIVRPLLKERKKFDHKGRFGHGLLAGGAYGKMGAVVLGARAALRTGIGLLTCHIPSSGNIILQSTVPEAMMVPDTNVGIISGIAVADFYSAVGVGPGMGTDPVTQKAIYTLLDSCHKPMVIDADALNILSINKSWMKLLTPGTILTPHPGEFERLAGKTKSGYERLNRQIEISAKFNCIIVLKGAHTSISGPDGNVWFNSTGNPGMATGGSGDVLTGMILSLLAQGYKPVEAAKAAVYLHGLAGDQAAGKRGVESMLSSDISEEIGAAFDIIKNAD